MNHRCQLIEHVNEMHSVGTAHRAAGQTVGLVPTMGFLHEGHLSLLEAAKRDCDVVVLSIFVNPLQFGPQEDFSRYPRNLPRDLQMAGKNGVDYLFHPTVEEMYPKPAVTRVRLEGFTDVMCGASRPGHFDGVATVVSKLFHIVQPDKAYFGQKDAQQLAVLQRMAEDLNFPVKVVGCPTVREADGLALSSRNNYLTEEQRAVAPCLYQSLQKGAAMIENGENRPERVTAEVTSALSERGDFRIDYVALLSYPDLTPPPTMEVPMVLAAAVWLGETRLIDNIMIS